MGIRALNLTDRDRRILRLSIPVVAVLLVLIVARGLWHQRQGAAEHLERTLEDVAWMQARGSAIASQAGGCRGGELNAKTIVSMASGYGIDGKVEPVVSGAVQLEVSSVAGNRMLDLVAEIQCRGGRVSALELVADGVPGQVSGKAVILLPVT